MNGYTVLLLVAALIVLGVSRIARQIVFHPLQTGIHAVKDLIAYIRHKGWNTCPVGALDIYCGYFGSGSAIDDDNDTLTVTIVAMDELSVQMNSRSFKDNFNAYFLNTLLCCRHYHISFYGSAQRFQHVDKLLRDVTHTVIQCHKVWRFQLWASYDAWEMENATNAEMIKPLRKGLWFVLDRDYNAYDTLAVVDNLQKKFEEGDILPESEIISNQAPVGPLGLEVASKPTNKAKRRLQTTVKK